MNDVAQVVPVKTRMKRGTYTAQYVLERAKAEGWAKSSDWRAASLSSYMAASRNGWLQEVYLAMGWKVRKSKKAGETSEPEVLVGDGQD